MRNFSLLSSQSLSNAVVCLFTNRCISWHRLLCHSLVLLEINSATSFKQLATSKYKRLWLQLTAQCYSSVQECDATGDAMKSGSWNQNKIHKIAAELATNEPPTCITNFEERVLVYV